MEMIEREDTSTEQEEQEWLAIVAKPHVRAALRRMAQEARRHYLAGETMEDGREEDTQWKSL